MGNEMELILSEPSYLPGETLIDAEICLVIEKPSSLISREWAGGGGDGSICFEGQKVETVSPLPILMSDGYWITTVFWQTVYSSQLIWIEKLKGSNSDARKGAIWLA